MANTVTIDAQRQELWSNELMDDAQQDVENIFQFKGEEANNVIQVSRELAKKKGDKQNFGLRTRLKGNGVTGDDELEGNEEAMSTYNESVEIDQIRHAVRLKGKLDDQKVTYDQIEEGREGLRTWLVEFLAHQIVHKLGGVTNTTLVDTEGEVVSARALWSNTADYIPDADEAAGIGNRYLCANAGGTDALTAADKMTLDLVTKIKTKAKLSNPRIQPLVIDGKKYYVLYLHPLQVRDIKLSSDWKTAQQNAQARAASNPVFTGVLGEWDGVLLMENEYMPWLDVSVAGNSFRGPAVGTDCAVDCARALLCGRQAAVMAEVSNPKALVVKRFDYDNKDGVAVSFIGGVQKTMFNSKEFGVIALDTAAAV